jgi:hypothetical protein
MVDRQARKAVAADFEALSTTERLLLKYPEISPEERDSIAAFLKNGDPIDVGLLSSNRQAWANAERFKEEHRHYFRIARSTYLYLGGIVAVLAFGLAMLKDIGIN